MIPLLIASTISLLLPGEVRASGTSSAVRYLLDGERLLLICAQFLENREDASIAEDLPDGAFAIIGEYAVTECKLHRSNNDYGSVLVWQKKNSAPKFIAESRAFAPQIILYDVIRQGNTYHILYSINNLLLIDRANIETNKVASMTITKETQATGRMAKTGAISPNARFVMIEFYSGNELWAIDGEKPNLLWSE